jgi:hypothetical protein
MQDVVGTLWKVRTVSSTFGSFSYFIQFFSCSLTKKPMKTIRVLTALTVGHTTQNLITVTAVTFDSTGFVYVDIPGIVIVANRRYVISVNNNVAVLPITIISVMKIDAV